MSVPKLRQRGVTLIELMISITLGLIVLLAVTTVFVNASQTRNELEKSNRQVQTGRAAAEILSNNLRMAAYLGEFDPTPLTTSALAGLPDICATSISDLLSAMPLHVQGINNIDVSGAVPACLGSDVKPGTDVIVVRRASTCVAGAADCAAFLDGAPHIQVSLCQSPTELGFSPTSNADYAAHYFTMASAAGAFPLHKADCTTLADVRRYLVDIYFIANNNDPGDGVPTLKRAELGAGGFSIVPLIDGVENMQIDYGLDTDGDGLADVYAADPSSYGGCTGNACVTNWRNAVSARIALFARNPQASGGYTDTRTYTLGIEADGSTKTVGPFNDGYKRHVYSQTVQLTNPAWRRQ